MTISIDGHAFVTEFDVGDIVYLKSDHESRPHQILGFQYIGKNFEYILAQGMNPNGSYLEIEITASRPVW